MLRRLIAVDFTFYQFIPLYGTRVIKWESPDNTVRMIPEMVISAANKMREFVAETCGLLKHDNYTPRFVIHIISLRLALLWTGTNLPTFRKNRLSALKYNVH